MTLPLSSYLVVLAIYPSLQSESEEASLLQYGAYATFKSVTELSVAKGMINGCHRVIDERS